VRLTSLLPPKQSSGNLCPPTTVVWPRRESRSFSVHVCRYFQMGRAFALIKQFNMAAEVYQKSLTVITLLKSELLWIYERAPVYRQHGGKVRCTDRR
jgi:hypothetical protein